MSFHPLPAKGFRSAFTLIEMSLVLVIIGLIAGGVLMGQDLISAAAVRAQISQIDKYQTAVHTFQTKYGYLPGDIPNPYASNFGLQSRGSNAGEGDGNGLLEGNCGDAAGANNGFQQGCGEIAVFWVDLSRTNLIDADIQGYDTKGAGWPDITQFHGNITLTSTPTITSWFPAARLGQGNFIYIFSLNGVNFFSVSSVTKTGWNIESTVNPGITVQQAYMVDSKIDDGLPQSGNIWAASENYQVWGGSCVWAAAYGVVHGGAGGYMCVPTTNATVYASTNCYDNGGNAGVQKYSLTNASQPNCALSFKFQ